MSDSENNETAPESNTAVEPVKTQTAADKYADFIKKQKNTNSIFQNGGKPQGFK